MCLHLVAVLLTQCRGISLKLPVGPARFLKARHYIAAIFAAVLGLSLVTGFVWAPKSVTLVVDGSSRTVMTGRPDVASVLSEAGVSVSARDLVSPVPSDPIDDGSVIIVRHVAHVTLIHNGEPIALEVVGRTVADALIMAGLDPTGGISTDPAVDAPLVDGMTVTAKDVFLRVDEEDVTVPYGSVVIGDPGLPRNKKVTVTKGVRGSAVRVWQVLVTGGVEGTRTLAADTVLTPAVDEVVRIGTKSAFRQVIPAKGAADHVRTRSTTVSAGRPTSTPPIRGRVIAVEATAYTPYACGLDADWIAWRRRLFDVPAGWGIVAVDRAVIPLGTRLFVEGYGYAVAGDTGSAIKGLKMDVCFWGPTLSSPTGHASAAQELAARTLANRWGRKRGLRVTILGD
jgi:uncharacterized protein YabE (DUF348 family)/3D (Asp-Asp-Asp) domain-containing protein